VAGTVQAGEPSLRNIMDAITFQSQMGQLIAFHIKPYLQQMADVICDIVPTEAKQATAQRLQKILMAPPSTGEAKRDPNFLPASQPASQTGPEVANSAFAVQESAARRRRRRSRKAPNNSAQATVPGQPIPVATQPAPIARPITELEEDKKEEVPVSSLESLKVKPAPTAKPLSTYSATSKCLSQLLKSRLKKGAKQDSATFSSLVNVAAQFVMEGMKVPNANLYQVVNKAVKSLTPSSDGGRWTVQKHQWEQAMTAAKVRLTEANFTSPPPPIHE